MSQSRFAALLCFSTVSISRWESGRAKPLGYGVVVLELLEDAVQKRPPATVIGALKRAAHTPRLVVEALVRLTSDGPPSSFGPGSRPTAS